MCVCVYRVFWSVLRCSSRVALRSLCVICTVEYVTIMECVLSSLWANFKVMCTAPIRQRRTALPFCTIKKEVSKRVSKTYPGLKKTTYYLKKATGGERSLSLQTTLSV